MAKKERTLDPMTDHVEIAWHNAVATHLGGGPEVFGPPTEPHPNEVATRAAVAAGVYDAKDVGA